MVLLNVVGSAVVGAAVLAFNPLSALNLNPFIIQLITAGIGVALYFLAGRTGKFSTVMKIAGAGFMIGGLVPLIAGLLGMFGQGVSQRVSL